MKRELSSAFDKLLLHLCGKNQTHLYQAVCISTQSTPQTSVFQKRNRQKNILTDLLVWNKMVQSSLKWLLGSSRRCERLTWWPQGQLQIRLRFCSKLQIKRIHNKHIMWRILRSISIIDKVSLKLHKVSSKIFCLDTVNFFYSPSDENANSPC